MAVFNKLNMANKYFDLDGDDETGPDERIVFSKLNMANKCFDLDDDETGPDSDVEVEYFFPLFRAGVHVSRHGWSFGAVSFHPVTVFWNWSRDFWWWYCKLKKGPKEPLECA